MESLIRWLECNVLWKRAKLEVDLEEKIKYLNKIRGRELIEELMLELDTEDEKQTRILEKRRLKKVGWWKSWRGRRYLTKDLVEQVKGILVELLIFNKQKAKMPGKEMMTKFGYETGGEERRE